MNSDWLAPVELRGQRLRLTPLALDDAADFVTALGPPEVSAEVLAHMSFFPPADTTDATKIITEAHETPDRLAYAQRIAETGELIGSTSFYEIKQAFGSLAVGHTWFARPYWRTGVNTDSKLIMLARAFEELGAERVVWHTDILNTRSQAAIERLGAQQEGILRHHRTRPNGTWRDTVQYSMLSAEWPEAKARLTASLER